MTLDYRTFEGRRIHDARSELVADSCTACIDRRLKSELEFRRSRDSRLARRRRRRSTGILSPGRARPRLIGTRLPVTSALGVGEGGGTGENLGVPGNRRAASSAKVAVVVAELEFKLISLAVLLQIGVLLLESLLSVQIGIRTEKVSGRRIVPVALTGTKTVVVAFAVALVEYARCPSRHFGPLGGPGLTIRDCRDKGRDKNHQGNDHRNDTRRRNPISIH